MNNADPTATHEMLVADIKAQLDHIAGLENARPVADFVDAAEEHLRRALIALEEAFA